MNKIKCPVCKMEDAISQSDYKQETVVSPAPSGTIGNYDLGYTGGDWNYSHAESCLGLLGVHDKEGLLRFFNKDVEIWKSDLNTFEDYNNLLMKEWLQIHPICTRQNNAWVYGLSIKEVGGFGRILLETKGRDLDDAFMRLKHRMLCGEIIYFERFKKFQFSQKENELTLTQLFY